MHIVCERDGWVLDRTASLIAAHLPGTTIGPEVSLTADVNVYFPYYELRQKGPSIDVALYTHREKEGKKLGWWNDSLEWADWCLGMSRKTLALLPPNRSSLLDLPADPALALGRKVRFGVCGRSYTSGRKRTDWIGTLSTLPGTEWFATEGQVPQEKMADFYAHIDYLVIASDNEGGPLPLKEAMACGKPVIAPDVGWAWEYPVIRYSGYDELLRTIKQLIPKDTTRDAARTLNSVCWQLAHKENDDGRLRGTTTQGHGPHGQEERLRA